MLTFTKEQKLSSMIAAGEIWRECPHICRYQDGEIEDLDFYLDVKNVGKHMPYVLVIWKDVALETNMTVFELGRKIGEGDDFYHLCRSLQNLRDADKQTCPNCDGKFDELISVCHTADAVCPDCAAEVEHDLAVYAMEANHAFINGGM